MISGAPITGNRFDDVTSQMAHIAHGLHIDLYHAEMNGDEAAKQLAKQQIAALEAQFHDALITLS